MHSFFEESMFAILAAIICVCFLHTCAYSEAYELNIYDSPSVPWETVIEVKNDCGYTHRLVVPIQEYEQSQNMISNWTLTVMDLCEKLEIGTEIENLNKKGAKRVKRSKN